MARMLSVASRCPAPARPRPTTARPYPAPLGSPSCPVVCVRDTSCGAAMQCCPAMEGCGLACMAPVKKDGTKRLIAGDICDKVCAHGAFDKKSDTCKSCMSHAEASWSAWMEFHELDDGQFIHADEIWRHPKTRYMVFFGDFNTPMDYVLLDENRVTHLVNVCPNDEASIKRAIESPYDPGFTRLDFDISMWSRVFEQSGRGSASSPTQQGIQDVSSFYTPFFNFIDNALVNKKGVMIVCPGSPHKAWAASVAYLMHAGEMRVDSALQRMHERRPTTVPIGDLLMSLQMLNCAMPLNDPVFCSMLGKQ